LLHIFFFQAEDGIRDFHVTGVQMCALPIFNRNAKLPAFVGTVTPEGYVVAVVEHIIEPPAPDNAMVQGERAILANSLAQAEARAVIQQLRKQYEVKIEPLAAEVIAEENSF